MKKKILYIHHGIGIGGAPLSLLYLIQNLDKSNFHPVVLFLQDSEVIDLYKSKGIEVYGPLNLNDFPHTKIWNIKWYQFLFFLKVIGDNFKVLFFEAEKWFDLIKPDIVHLNTSSLIVWGKVAHKKGIPVVWHIREPLAPGYLGIRRFIIKKFVEKYATKIVPICKNDAKPWQNNPKVEVVYNAVDPKIFDYNLYPYANNDLKILFLGGLSKEKGTLVIFKAFEKLLKEIPNAKLVVAGYFNNQQSKSYFKYFLPSEVYKRQINKILEKIKDKIIFLGPIKNVPQIMAESSVIVFPATVGHFARPLIEAGFMKKAVIASNLSPLEELVIDQKTGYLINPQNIDEWADKLKFILLDNVLQRNLGVENFEFCNKHFSIKEQLKKIESIYENILKLNL
ncbi:TPA: hypothetical protein DEO28_05100 [Candidatus Dependentiae bacterium]|nr:MAG: Glycosyl transferase group 1 [candidate division TM6 bacterium GW2011_GWE2_31_21]KKP53930.1 MAG: Glycosyl transferase group 1 [candidate division TM6 bacterium GW2011_GWF2_33_332]HBS47710.1 hypothetical protein [Candidatus Dependentiae bacterium]HBZ73859.1 hypothetical protein [Candidatus Dependentiae bacterium]